MNLIQAEIFGKRMHTHALQSRGCSPKLKLGRKETAVTPKLPCEFIDIAQPFKGGSKLVNTLKAMKFNKNVASDYQNKKFNHQSPVPLPRSRFREVNSSCNSRKDHASQGHVGGFVMNEMMQRASPKMETGEAIVSQTEMFQEDRDRAWQLFTPTAEMQHMLAEQLHTDIDLNKMQMPQLDFSNLIDVAGNVTHMTADGQYIQCIPNGEVYIPGNLLKNDGNKLIFEANTRIPQIHYTQMLPPQVMQQSPSLIPSQRYGDSNDQLQQFLDHSAGKDSRSQHHQTQQKLDTNTHQTVVTTPELRDCSPPQIFHHDLASAPASNMPILIDQFPQQHLCKEDPSHLIQLENALQHQRKGVYQMSQGKRKMIDSQHVIQIQQSGYHLENQPQHSSMNHNHFSMGIDSGHFVSSTNTAVMANNSDGGQFQGQQSLCPQCSQPSQPSISHLQYGQHRYESPITTTITIVKQDAQQEQEQIQNIEKMTHDEELNKRVLEHNPQRFNRMAAYLPKRFLAKPLKPQQMQREAERVCPCPHFNYPIQDEVYKCLHNQMINPDLVCRPDLVNALAAYQQQQAIMDDKSKTQKVLHKLVYNPVSEQVPLIQMNGQGDETDIAGSDCNQNITISDRNHDVTVSDHADHEAASKMTELKSITPRHFTEFEMKDAQPATFTNRAFQTIQERAIKQQGTSRQMFNQNQGKRPTTKTSDFIQEPAAGFTNLKQFKAKKKMKVESPSGQSFIVEDPNISKNVTQKTPRVRSSMNRSITSVNSSVQSKCIRQSNRTPLNQLQLMPQDISRQYDASSEQQFQQFMSN